VRLWICEGIYWVTEILRAVLTSYEFLKLKEKDGAVNVEWATSGSQWIDYPLIALMTAIFSIGFIAFGRSIVNLWRLIKRVVRDCQQEMEEN